MTPDRTLALLELSPDLSAAEWAQRLDVSAAEVRTYCAAQGLALADAPLDATDVATELVRRQSALGVSWHHVARGAGLDVQQVIRFASRPRGPRTSRRVTEAIAGWLARTAWRAPSLPIAAPRVGVSPVHGARRSGETP